MPSLDNLLSLKKFPHPSLRKKATTVEDFSEIKNIYNHMLLIMYENSGIGLAANQVGLEKRLFVMDLSEEKNQPFLLINPEIIGKSDTKQKILEGCLSLPGIWSEISRPQAVMVRYIDINGKICEQEFTALASSCVQHEIDHLDGKLFPDHLPLTKQTKIWKEYLSSLKK